MKLIYMIFVPFIFCLFIGCSKKEYRGEGEIITDSMLGFSIFLPAKEMKAENEAVFNISGVPSRGYEKQREESIKLNIFIPCSKEKAVQLLMEVRKNNGPSFEDMKVWVIGKNSPKIYYKVKQGDKETFANGESYEIITSTGPNWDTRKI